MQVVRKLPLESDSEFEGEEWGKATDRIRSIHDAAAFVDQIAIKRIGEMKNRADRGVFLLEEVQKRLKALKEDIGYTVSKGWVRTNDQGEVVSIVHLPSLDDLTQEWTMAWEWIKREGIDVWEIAKYRDFEFNSRREKSRTENNKGYPDRHIIWSRWSMQDRRTDPEGDEAFCWEPLVKAEGWDTDDKRDWPWGSWTGRKKADEKDGKLVRPRCGDASRRHGDFKTRH